MATQAHLTWIDGMQFVGRSGDAPALVLDNPKGGSGASPMELVLIGVAGCTAMDVVSIMKKKRAPLTGMQVNVASERAADHPKRYTEIRIEFVIYGNGIRPIDVERSIELSVTKYCSAIASLNANFEHTYRIVEDE